MLLDNPVATTKTCHSLNPAILLPTEIGALKHGCVENDAAAAKSSQSSPTLCDPIDGSPPGSAVPGILQERTLEWGAIAFSGVENDRHDLFQSP